MADTREQILQSAWNLFAEKGFENVSVRDVTSSAGVNLASVSYHFGGKDGLVQEIVKRCLDPLYKYGRQLLTDATNKYGDLESIPIEHLLTCWLRPLLLSEECGVRFDLILRLIARYLIEIDYAVPVKTQQLMADNYRIYIDAFKVHFPKASKDQIIKYMIFVEGAAIYSSGIGRGITQLLNGQPVNRLDVDRKKILSDIVCCAVHGFGSEKVE